MADDMGERTEKPTARRRSESRRKGDVAKSQDLVAVAKLIAAAIILSATLAWLGRGLARVLAAGLSGSTDPGVTTASVNPWFREAMWAVATLSLPLLLGLFLVAAIASYLQVGWLITLQPIKPKIKQLNPIKGAKKLVGLRSLVKSGMNIVKASAMILVAVLVIRARLDTLGALPHMTALGAFAMISRLIFELLAWLLVILLIIAIIDLIYQRWQHTRDLRMTKQEVKDERRMMEGDPKVKNKRFAMYQKMVGQQIAQAVPQADVIVTNPTHFSVALKYEAGDNAAPVVTAKGADELAMRIRYLAAMNNVPIVARPPLARALYWGVEVGRPIRPEHYEAVAEILAYVYRIDARRRENAGVAAS